MDLDPKLWLDHILRSAVFGVGGLLLFFLAARFFLQRQITWAIVSLVGIWVLGWIVPRETPPPDESLSSVSLTAKESPEDPRWFWITGASLLAGFLLALAYFLGQSLQRQRQEIGSPDEQAAFSFLHECHQRGLRQVQVDGQAEIFQIVGSRLLAGTRSFSLQGSIFYPDPEPHLQLADGSTLNFVGPATEENPSPAVDINSSPS
jgi:hypothetical protein